MGHLQHPSPQPRIHFNCSFESFQEFVSKHHPVRIGDAASGQMFKTPARSAKSVPPKRSTCFWGFHRAFLGVKKQSACRSGRVGHSAGSYLGHQTCKLTVHGIPLPRKCSGLPHVAHNSCWLPCSLAHYARCMCRPLGGKSFQEGNRATHDASSKGTLKI